MKTLIIYIFIALINIIINFVIYNYSFNLQATPFLHEEQRVESAMLMLKETFPAYIASGVIFTIIFFYIAKFVNRKN